MLNYQSEYFLQSAPFKIFWAGFESDTLRLQNNGWTLAVEDRCDFALARHEVRFILKHEMLNLYAYTYVNAFEFSDLTDYLAQNKEHLRFSIQVIAKDIIYSSIPEFSMESIKEIDCSPEFIQIERHSIKDLSIFKTLIKPDNALIIEPERIGELLQKIVDAQAPNQKEIRERIRKSDARSAIKQTLHAQILTIAA
jgi:hypothetical protein